MSSQVDDLIVTIWSLSIFQYLHNNGYYKSISSALVRLTVYVSVVVSGWK